MKHSPVRIFGVCLAVVAALCVHPMHAEDPVSTSFLTPGETLSYDVTWSVFPAGRLTATLIAPPKGSGGSYEVRTTAESKGFVSLLYDVEDEFHSFFNPATLCSQSISKKINEGRRHKETNILFDYTRKLAILNEHDPTNPKAPSKHDEKSIPACVEDVISAFYFLRGQPLRVGDKINLAVNDGSPTTNVVVEVQAREQIQTGLGARAALRVEPKVFGSLYPRKGRMLIWFSDDAEHLPLRIKMMISIGDITGTLSSVTTPGSAGAPASKSDPATPHP